MRRAFVSAIWTTLFLGVIAVILLLSGVNIFRLPWLWVVAWLSLFVPAVLPAPSKRTRRQYGR